MADDPATIRNRARIGLGLSIVFSVLAAAWFWSQGAVTRAFVAAALILGIGVWEYQRRLRTEGSPRRYQMDRSRDDRDRE
jgi:hypothetical protein